MCQFAVWPTREEPASFAGCELQIEPHEDLPPGNSRAGVLPDRVLGLDEEVGRGPLIDLPDVADAEADRDEVVVVFEVEVPDARRPEVPALRQVIGDDRLDGQETNVGAIVVSRKRLLMLDKRG